MANIHLQRFCHVDISKLAMSNPTCHTKDMTFLRKVYRILTHENSLVVGWDVSGTHLAVKSTTKMEASILPHYFRSTGEMTYATFRKQLVAHGFSMVDQTTDSETFCHPEYTRRSSSALASTMKRRRPMQPRISDATASSQPCPRHSQGATTAHTNENLWHLLATVCSMKGNPLFPHSAACEETATYTMDGWTELATPAVVCL